MSLNDGKASCRLGLRASGRRGGVLTQNEEDCQQDAGEDRRPEVGDRAIREYDAQHPGADHVNSSQHQEQAQSAGGKAELPAQPSGPDGEED